MRRPGSSSWSQAWSSLARELDAFVTSLIEAMESATSSGSGSGKKAKQAKGPYLASVPWIGTSCPMGLLVRRSMSTNVSLWPQNLNLNVEIQTPAKFWGGGYTVIP